MALDSVKKFFGMTQEQKYLKTALKKAYLYIRNEYAKLSVFENEHDYDSGCADELKDALEALKNFSNVGGNQSLKGRSYVNTLLTNESLSGDSEGDFVRYAALMEDIRLHTPIMTSSLPYSSISDLATIALKYIIYIKSFEQAENLFSDKFSVSNKILYDNKELTSKAQKELKKTNNTLDNLIKKINDTKKRDPGNTFTKIMGWIDKYSGKLGRVIEAPIDSFNNRKSQDTAFGWKYWKLVNGHGCTNKIRKQKKII